MEMGAFHLLDPERTEGWVSPYLQLGCTALAAHSVAAGAEGRVDLLLAARHTQHGFLQLAQLFLQHPSLLAAEALTAAAAHAAVGGLQRGAGRALVTSRDKVHNASVVQSPPGMVIDLFGCSLDVEDVFLTKVNVFIQKQRCQVALQVATVLHHDGAGDCVTPEQKPSVNTRLSIEKPRELHNSDYQMLLSIRTVYPQTLNTLSCLSLDYLHHPSINLSSIIYYHPSIHHLSASLSSIYLALICFLR